jgi:hypothetical protein
MLRMEENPHQLVDDLSHSTPIISNVSHVPIVTNCCRISQPSTVGLPTFIQLQLIPGHVPPPPHSRQPRRPHLGCTLPPLPSAPDASWLMSIVSQVGVTHANNLICWHVWAKRLQLLPFSDSSLTVICHSTKTTS